jgi:hypothetical protein
MPIPIEALRQVRRIIVHRDCADGTASAMILHDALPEAIITAVAYGAERDALEPEPGLLFCDMSPPGGKVDAFVEAGAIVLDHHKGARELVERFGEHGVLADEDDEPGVSGAWLAYCEVWLPLTPACTEPVGDDQQQLRRFAHLAGVRDTWQTGHESWSDACAQAEVLMFYGLNEMIERANLSGEPWLTEQETILGISLLGKKLRRAREIPETGCLRLSPSVAIFNDAPKPDSRISDVAEAMREVDPAVKLVCGFYYEARGDRMLAVFSLRSSPGAELSAKQIAVANGGGGHEHAAGFTQSLTDKQHFSWKLKSSPVEIFKSALASAALP